MRLLVCVIAVTGWTASASAADPRATAIAPFIDDQTIAIGWVDPGPLDLDAIEALALGAAKGSEDGDQENAASEIAATKADAKAWLAEFKKAGGKDLYMVASLADLPQAEKPFVVAPLGPNANVQAISALLFSGKADGPTSRSGPVFLEAYPNMTVERIGSAVVLGAQKTVERLRELKPAPRPEIASAFEAAGDVPACILIVPTTDNRRVLEDMIPTLPAELGGGSITVVTRGFMWMSLGIETKGAVSVKAIIQSQDAAAAQALAGVIDNGLQAVSKNRWLQEKITDFPRLIALLKPAVREDRLVVDLKGETMREAVEKLLVPALAQSRAVARRVTSANNMTSLMTALYKYADKHEHQWPADLDVLVKENYSAKANLVNPARPGITPSYVYIRPSEPSNKVPSERLVMYEAYAAWEGGIYVADADATVQFVTDEAEFKKRLAEAIEKGTITGTATQPAAPAEKGKP